MATNRSLIRGRQITVTPTDGGTNAGDPCLCGQIPGVSMNGGGLVAQVIDTLGVYNLSVKGANNVGNTAVAQGDILYYNTAASPKINKDNVTAGNVRYGYALDPVVSGATTTIRVRLGY